MRGCKVLSLCQHPRYTAHKNQGPRGLESYVCYGIAVEIQCARLRISSIANLLLASCAVSTLFRKNHFADLPSRLIENTLYLPYLLIIEIRIIVKDSACDFTNTSSNPRQ